MLTFFLGSVSLHPLDMIFIYLFIYLLIYLFITTHNQKRQSQELKWPVVSRSV